MKRVKTFRFSEADLAVLDALSEASSGVSEAESLLALLAEGLRHRMEHGDPPVHLHFTESLKGECIRPGTPLSLEDARRLVAGYVGHYNTVRLQRHRLRGPGGQAGRPGAGDLCPAGSQAGRGPSASESGPASGAGGGGLCRQE